MNNLPPQYKCWEFGHRQSVEKESVLEKSLVVVVVVIVVQMRVIEQVLA